MNEPYILQRFELQGSSLLIIEGTKFQMEPCSAVAYIALKQDANKEELVQIMKNALYDAYGKQMDIVVAETIVLGGESPIPLAFMEEIGSLYHIPFALEYIPKIGDMNLYHYFNERLIPTLHMELFVPDGHIKYFDARSVQLHYEEIHKFDEWIELENKVAELKKQCMAASEWLPIKK